MAVQRILTIDNPADLPDPSSIDKVLEPYLKVTVITPSNFTGTIMDLCQQRRGEMVKMEYLSPERLEIQYRMPLGEVVTDFFDQMTQHHVARAVVRGGSTLRDFSDVNGQSGHFQLDAMVYGRAGLPCRVCGTPIRQIRQGQRSTFFCQMCQKY